MTLCDPTEGAKLRQVERIIRMRLPVTADHTGEPDPERAPRAALPASGNGTPHAANDSRPARKPAGDKPFRGKPNGAKKPFRGRRRGGFGRKPAARAA